MADPSSEEDGILREWAPLTGLLQQIPLKAQRGLFTHDLSLTCVDTLPEFIAVGTNLGLVYWYSRKKGDLQRLRCEHLSKSVELLNEKYEIVQLSYSQQLLLVSTLYRSIVCCYRDQRWKVAQVGQKERKTLGRLGATFCLGSGRPQELVVYASRPGLRVWLADKNGVVQQTLIYNIYKDSLMSEHTRTPLINPAPAHVRQSRGDHQFGPVLVFRESLLVTYSSSMVYVLDPATVTVVATVADVRKVHDVAVSKDEIFILEGERSLIRVAYTPENPALMPVAEVSYASSADALVHTMSNPDVQSLMADKSCPKKAVWDFVSAEMERLGYPMGDRCRQKWNNIVRNYHHYVRTSKFDVKAHRPTYYSELEKMFARQSDASEMQENKRKISDGAPSRRKLGRYDASAGDGSSSDTPSSPASSEGNAVQYVQLIQEDNTSDGFSFSFSGQYNGEEFIFIDPVAEQRDEVVTVYPYDLSADDETLPEESGRSMQINQSLANFLQATKPTTSRKSKNAATIVVSPKPNQPSRPIPTAAEALASLLIRLQEQERRKERGQGRRHEARLDRLEALLQEQTMRQKKLLDAALLTLNELNDD
ncbi:hypothetical protein C0J52_06251 [Blattella germanica]|nr:hypothetical protein C0J52_06251 [Blattella germanica]